MDGWDYFAEDSLFTTENMDILYHLNNPV